MKRGNFKLVIFAFMLISIVGFVFANDLFVQIPTPPQNVGDNFQVNIVGTTTTDIHSIQFDVTYDDSVLTLNDVDEGNFMNEGGGIVTIFNYSSYGGGLADDVYVARNTTWQSPDPGANGTGTIAILNFSVDSFGSSNIGLTDVIWVNTSILNASVGIENPTITNNSVTISPPASCDLTSANWSITDAVEGQQVQLIVEGTNCAGQQINYTIWEWDPTIFSPDDFITTLANTFDRASWNALYTDEGGLDPNPEYYFVAYVVSNPSESITSSGGYLSVTEDVINNEVLLIPRATQVTQGESFEVEVHARAPLSASDIYGLQFDLVYPSSALILNTVQEGPMLSESGLVDTIFNYTRLSGLLSNVYNVRNITFEGSNIGLYDDDGVVAILNFTAISPGDYNLGLNDVIWVNSTIENASVGIPGIIVSNATVSIQSGSNVFPIIEGVECYIDSSWQPCTNLGYGESLMEMRSNCSDSDGTVSSVFFELRNVEDSKVIVDGYGINGLGNVWNFDFANFALNDSGNMELGVTCLDNLGGIGTSTNSWFVNWGQLVSVINSPSSVSTNVSQYSTFLFNTGFTCVGGECGNVTVTLDPTVQIAIAQGSDDVCVGHANSNYMENVFLRFGNDQWEGNVDTGLRFQNVQIPQGSVINSATIKFVSRGTYAADVVRSIIVGQNTDNPPTFSSYADFISRPKTSNFVQWNNVPHWTFGMVQYTPDISSVIQEIVNKPYWNAGDSMVIFVQNNGSDALAERMAIDYSDGSYGYAVNPLNVVNITINYTESGSVMSKGGAVSTTVGATPFYTTSTNPVVCSNMKGGGTCPTSWIVNATGPVGNNYEFYVIYDSSYGYNNQSAKRYIMINDTYQVVDVTPPVFDNLVDQNLFMGESLSYNLDATDPEGHFDGFRINNTANFNINYNTGLITNITQLSLGTYTILVTINDTYGNTNTGVFNVIVNSQPDTAPPVRSNPQPSTGALPSGTIQAYINLTTDENANCRYSLTAGLPYGSMIDTFSTTGGTFHNQLITGFTSGETRVYNVRCQDMSPNLNTNDNDFYITVTIQQGATCTDSDGDLYSAEEDPTTCGGLCTGGDPCLNTPGIRDCNDGNPSINEGATEICTDGLDNNCNDESDYDNSDGLRGDSACVVDVGASVPMPPGNYFWEENEIVTTDCGVTVGQQINSVHAEVVGEGQCTFINYYVGTGVYEFNCSAGSYIGGANKTVNCYIDQAVTYSNIQSRSFQINVTQLFDYDVNDDNYVNVGDFVALIPYFGRDDCHLTPDWCAGRDVNRDGNVNVFDLQQIGRHFSN